MQRLSRTNQKSISFCMWDGLGLVYGGKCNLCAKCSQKSLFNHRLKELSNKWQYAQAYFAIGF